MNIYYYKPIECGTGYAVLAESENEAMIYIRNYLFTNAKANPFGEAMDGSHYLTNDLEEFIKWRYIPIRLVGYTINIYEKGQILTTSIE